jgi:hypothetical protein
LTGLAPRILERSLAAVIAMQHPLPDHAAQTFSREFYRALVAGSPVDRAVSEARNALYVDLGGGRLDWGTPVLFLRCEDGKLFERPAEDRQMAPGTVPRTEYSRPLGQGLTALAELMQSPEARAHVVAFRTDFQAAREQVNSVGFYKDIHDLLHTLQFHCYNPIVQEARHFPDDDMATDNLMNHELTLKRIISGLEDVADGASLASRETLWIQDLARAHDVLEQAIDGEDAKRLKRAIWLLNRVLSIQPSQINARLNAAARSLRLPALVEAMTHVIDNLDRLDLDPAKVGQFRDGVDTLASLSHGLATLVEEHDRWQAVDLELRRIEANLGQDMLELEMSWPDLKVMAEPLYLHNTDKWAQSLREDSKTLDAALASENVVRTRRRFRRYRRQASTRFYHVDVDLKELCDDLRAVGEPLASVMRMIE